MPWKTTDLAMVRAQLVEAAATQKESFTALCARFGVTRVTGYKWLKRAAAGGAEPLANRGRGPAKGACDARRRRWEKEVLELRRKYPHWGPLKLRVLLRGQARHARLPSVRTIARILQRHQLSRPGRHRSRHGPWVAAPARAVARRCHDIWTVDFKGHFRTGDRALCRPLTVRDLWSRYLLVVTHVPAPSEEAVRAVMTRCFRRHGLPRVIRVDNGAPFAGQGLLGLSRLSAWWMRLGIRVEFTRRGKPQDNGAHEQMHRILKTEVATPPASTLAEQKQQLERFRRRYNDRRPHGALGQRYPKKRYRPSPRRYALPLRLQYPAEWQSEVVGVNGTIYWAGRQRLIGHALRGERIGLPPGRAGKNGTAAQVRKVYWRRLWIGELHRQDPGGMRAVRRQNRSDDTTPRPSPK